MRLEIDGGGFAVAAAAFENGNQSAAMHHDELAAALEGYAAMAGDDSTSADFAATYDEAAAESLGALGDLVASFAGLGRLTTAAFANHARAEESSVLMGAQVYDGTIPDSGYVTVLPTTPPSSLGGDSSSFPSQLNWIVDHVEGFVWPNADTDRLRAAAATWRRSSTRIRGLTEYGDGAVRGFWGQHSPEVPLAVTATHDLTSAVDDLAEQLTVIAAACEEYADHVEEQRQAILDLIWSLLRDAVVIQGIGIVLSSVTAGLTAGGAAALNGIKIAAEAPKFARVIATLRTLAAATADGIRLTLTFLARIRTRLRKFVDARLAMRSEAGAIDFTKRGPGWLGKHEVRGSHTVRTHVGRSLDDLAARLRSRPGLETASTFPSEDAAERFVSTAIAKSQAPIAAWMAQGSARQTFTMELGHVVGQMLPRGADALIDTTRLRFVLVRDPGMPNGWRILTAFPDA